MNILIAQYNPAQYIEHSIEATNVCNSEHTVEPHLSLAIASLQLLVGVRLLGLAVLRDDEEEEEEEEEDDAEGEGERVEPSGQVRGQQLPATVTQSPSRERANPVQSPINPTPIRVSVFAPRSPPEPARRESVEGGDERDEGLRRRVRARQGTRSPPSSVV
jgi:hypothetical protein